MLDGRLSNEIISIPSSLKDSQRREGVRGGVHKFLKGPRGQGGLLIWTNVGPTNQRGGLWPTIAKGPALTLVADHVCNLS